ncbi:hypothetical protein K438DRAFT_1806629 [Mycena galopus ATCC 62051]|nr:hypothetical protein K438DRAFT_1806629 [Mycena galopus ATCC 62051]
MSTFTPTTPVNMSNERDWANDLGMLDWDSTSIVFTKRSLLDFLKSVNVTVDTNFQNIRRLPQYAKFGKLSDAAVGPPAVHSAASLSDVASTVSASASSDFKPTRRVREPPGGARTNIFADEEVPDALSMAPPKEVAPVASNEPAAPSSDFKPTRRVREPPGGARSNIFGDEEADTSPVAPRKQEAAANPSAADAKDEAQTGTGIKPSRRVREAPGGNSSIGSIWGNDEPEEFKPTRRVRQAPGGGVSGIF